MKPKDIKVGQLYTNGCDLYLGCGKRVMWENKFTNEDARFTHKRLVNVTPGKYMGQIVQNPTDCWVGFWDDFVEVKS